MIEIQLKLMFIYLSLRSKITNFDIKTQKIGQFLQLGIPWYGKKVIELKVVLFYFFFPKSRQIYKGRSSFYFQFFYQQPEKGKRKHFYQQLAKG